MSKRFKTLFDLTVPIGLAPMALASGGALAAACARAGALGLVGGGYGELAWTQREYALACALASRPSETPPAPSAGSAATSSDLARIGIGFITWKLDENASALDWTLDQAHPPAAVMVSFGDPRPYAARIAAVGARLICQVQTMAQVPLCLEAGAHIIVAQGAEAGGHGMNALNGRSTLTLVPELADWLAANAPQTVLLAAGGIADARTLAAVQVLGADGALVGSRLWATQESLAAPGAKTQAVATDGDGTARSPVFDILRRKNWPAPYDFRAIRNDLHRRLESDLSALRATPDAARADYDAGVASGDFTRAHATVGEAVGLIHDLPGAAQAIHHMMEAVGRPVA